MARVKICPSCGSENASNEPFCARCGFVLADVEIAEKRVSHTETGVLPEKSLAAERAPGGGTWREPVASHSTGIGPILKFPWGDVEVVETLFIGRDQSVSQFGDRLEREGYGWVSRKHAELYVEDGIFYVRDLGSTHGTFVNGRRIENQPVALTDGDQVTFSRQLVATVRLG